MEKRWKFEKNRVVFLYGVSLLLFYVLSWLILQRFLFLPLKEERNEYIRNYAGQISARVLNQKERYEKTVLLLCENQLLIENLSEHHETPVEIWKSMWDVSSLFRSSREIGQNISSLAVYVQGSSLWTNGLYIFAEEPLERGFEKNYKWFEEQAGGVWYYSICSEINGLYNSVEAYIKLSIEGQKAFGSFIYFEEEIGGRAYLLGRDGKIIAASQQGVQGRHVGELEGGIDWEMECGRITEAGDDIALRTRVDGDWSVLVILPSAYTQSKMRGTYLVIGIIMLGIALVICVVLFQIVRRWYEDLEEMMNIRIQKQKFEVRALESQINPHFLYNTLGVMRWEALDVNSPRLVEMIDNLTVFYRRSLNHGNSFLTVGQEVELIRAYIAIQQERFDHCVKVEIEVDSGAQEVVIPKMILQPLVENIWIHGNITEPGRRYIGISVHRLEQERLQILVTDNGSGISQERLEQIKGGSGEEGSGIGISYIRSILQCYYQDNFIYEVRSREGEGTRVCLILPERLDEGAQAVHGFAE